MATNIFEDFDEKILKFLENTRNSIVNNLKNKNNASSYRFIEINERLK
ncbi:hypothetical protein CLV50_1890 [Flavobacterium lindanitolerans]|uniref:Uncharacterized protein n=1 Tax=Flavobacterium lindanitolerans TaxID=428988 RepID=A0A497UHX1_9FLAO|nr:hypothetical protein B0G92_2160 [Flavobacterium lindanitolerans]RLJ30480.1 hypothetical protein CLV50_1890 [Flavobacterium lindanitolerans]